MPKKALKIQGVQFRNFLKGILILLLTIFLPSLMACTFVGTPKSVIEVSKAEEEYYQNLFPALQTAKVAFEQSSAALDKSIIALEENNLIEESLAKREDVYRSAIMELSSQDFSTEDVRKAIDKLVTTDQRISKQIQALDEANEVRRKAILETFTAMDKSLRFIIKNKQVIHAHLEGKSAFPPITSFEDAILWLKETSKQLKEQFELAKQIVEEARTQFGDQL